MGRLFTKSIIASLIFVSAFGGLLLTVPQSVSAAGGSGFVKTSKTDSKSPPVVADPVAAAAAIKAANEKARQKAADAETKGCVGKFPWVPVPRVNITACIAEAANFVMWLSARTLWLSGILLNYALGYTLNMQDLLSQIPIVDIGWKVIRDIANIVFIFIALWSGISITIGIQAEKAWSLLAHMVLVALFINFSLFITKAIVDATNIAALHFYNLITPAEYRHNWDAGLSEAFMEGLKLQTLYDSKSLRERGISTGAGAVTDYIAGKAGNVMNLGSIILLGIFGSLLMMVAAFVFFAGAIMFVQRAITLIMLMVLSPLAFVAWILPGASGLASKWWSTLWSQSLFAPLYLALAYVVVATINSPAFKEGLTTISGGQDTFAAALTNDTPAFGGIIFSFIIMIGLLVGCLIVAKSLGAWGSEMMMDWGGRLKNAGQGLAGRFVMRGFGTETYRDWAQRKGLRYKELAENETDLTKKQSLMDLHHKWEKRAKSKWVPNLSLRKLDEKWERSGGIFGGKGALGSMLREQTTKRFVHDWTFGSGTSAAAAYEADEHRISAAKDDQYKEDAERAAERIKPLKADERQRVNDIHEAARLLAESARELDKAVEAETEAKKNNASNLSELTARREAAQRTVDDNRRRTKERLEEYHADFIQQHGAAIDKETRQIATALARMSTEGFLNMDKSFFTIPEIMNVTVLGADKYNALMASEHYTNVEKIEYTAARIQQIKEEGKNMDEAQKWYLEESKRVQKDRTNAKKLHDEWAKRKREHEKNMENVLAEMEADPERGTKKREADVKHYEEMVAASKDDAEKNENKQFLDEAIKLLEDTKKAVKDRGAALDAEFAALDKEPQRPNTIKDPPPPSWSPDMRKAMRNFRNPQELTNYYRYAREVINIPPFVQTVLQGMWDKLRESDQVDSYTKEQNRVNKRLYLLEADDYATGAHAVKMKRIDELDPVLGAQIRKEFNDEILKTSEKEFQQKYWTPGTDGESRMDKIFKDAAERLSHGNKKIYDEIADTASVEERTLRYDTGRHIMGNAIQNLADDEANKMGGSLRNLHFVKSVLNRGLFSAFKNRDLDVKIPDMERLIHSIGEMFKGNNALSKGNLDFIVYLVNERSGKEFIPWEQLNFKNPKEKILWEIIKSLSAQREDNQGSIFESKLEALRAAVKEGYMDPEHVVSPWREMGIHFRGEKEMSDEEFYGEFYNPEYHHYEGKKKAEK